MTIKIIPVADSPAFGLPKVSARYYGAVTRRFSHLSLSVGLGLSLLVHATVLVPVLVVVMRSSGQSQAAQGRFEPEDFVLPEEDADPPPEPDVQIGIDAQTPSTLTWIGYEEYQEHLARLAEVEQAALSEIPAGAIPSPAIPPVPQVEPAEQTATEEQPKKADTSEEPQPSPETPALPEWFTDLLVGVSPEAPKAMEVQPEESPAATPKKDPSPKPKETPPSKLKEETKEAPAKPVLTPPDPSKPASPGDPTEIPGDHADKESDAASTIEVPLDQIKLGKPIAREGLELKPRRPRFTTLTLITASPGNPLVEIRFAADGKPALARVLESSGDNRIDHAVASSLYRWRASGKDLEKLGKDETIDIRIRIILNPRVK